MNNLFINPNMASPAAQAVLAYLRRHDGIENSWDDESRCLARPEVSEWHNCREQGYVITMRSKDYSRQINIAFFEHRNSDNICAVEWEQCTTNPPTIDTANFGDKYKTKYDVSKSVRYDQALDMADWIYQRLTAFWRETVR